MEREIRAVPGLLERQSTSASLLQPELVIRPRPARAAELGVTTSAISQATRIATSGDITNNLAKLNLPDRQIPIRVRLNDAARSNIDQIKLLNVPSRFGPVPLMNVADISFGAGPSQITRYNRSRNITITADRGVIPLDEANAAIRSLPVDEEPAGRRAHGRDRRDGIHGRDLRGLRGRDDHRHLLHLCAAGAAVPRCAAAHHHPVGAAALGGRGRSWRCSLFRMELSLPALLGVLTLMGIVTKNSILLVEYAVMARREHGLNRFDALLDACSKRARPIVMTTIAMAAGMLPMTLGLSGDSAFSGAHGRVGDRRPDRLDGAVAVRRAGDLHDVRRPRAVVQEEVFTLATVDSSRGCFVA